MFSIQEYVRPGSVEEAYQLLLERRNNRILGGTAFLRLGSKRIRTALDLSLLGLNYIKEQDGYIEIGAMTTFRDLEVSTIIAEHFNGMLSKAVSNVLGVQFRNIVTVGASVFSHYGFSDLITALLALDAEIELYKAGRMPLADFLKRPREKDVLIRVLIPHNQRQASYQHLRKAASDFPILNVAVSRLDDKWLIAVGARPRKAAIAHQAGKQLTDGFALDGVADTVVEELTFGTNARAGAEYRQIVCRALVKRAVTEVMQCK
ncbi:FAD binding domain-containing protein [Dethiobacter alkaliphilus]|uniref:Molybdopterin dehydrogenase FAD-binding n=1 Tax=Dethiobacter alkaliphilus AHT 1 TaxID=555088 RepID=C0GH06_DETAL|nr:FAD binding domain-containing protein [Dethiobacter alkaliphilus]EEG77308.1 molybdopterin dehydrogenase FAD-binding [Dethiobacter alkaliphilus AHT 1]